MIKVFNKACGRRINGAGDGGLGGKNRPEAEHTERGGRGTEGRARCVPTLVFGTQPPAGPANLQACRYHHKRETWLRINDGVTTRDFKLILGLENAVPLATQILR